MKSNFLRFFVLAIAIFFLFNFAIFAKPITPDQAKEVADNWISYIVKNDGGWGSFSEAKSVSIEPFFVDDTLVGYIIHTAPTGFVLVSLDDELPPIKSYSTDAFFAPDANEFYKWLGQEMKEIVTYLKVEQSDKVAFSPVNKTLWQRFENKAFLESTPLVSAVPIPPLTTTAWDQMDPYNRLCPEYNGEKCPVGCVATATAQVMKYWSWPPQGTGSHSYTSQSHRFQLSADFNHPYYWDLMLDSYGFNTGTEDQKNVVAQLSYDLGVAFEMDYDPEGSGAYTTDAVQILPTYFFYSNQIAYADYPGNDTDWFNQFKTEIDNGRVSLMSIRGGAGGHAVVCDGYRTDQGNMLHLNFGWGGWGNAYYAINNIVVGGNDFTWVSGQEIVKQIIPNEVSTLGAASAASPMGGKSPVTVNFTGQGKRGTPPYSYQWDFGDGTPSQSGQSVSHIYNNAGVYVVTLTVTDSNNQTATDSHLKITVTSSSGLSVTFQTSTLSGQAPLSVDFTAIAQGGVPPYTYTWNFGDGNSQTTSETTISHTYTLCGNYTASLTVKDSINAQANSSTAINVIPATPVPRIDTASKASSPFRIKIYGSNFVSQAKVKINGVEVPQVVFKSGSQLIAKGGTALKNMCPKGVEVKITVENEPCNVSNEYKFTR